MPPWGDRMGGGGKTSPRRRCEGGGRIRGGRKGEGGRASFWSTPSRGRGRGERHSEHAHSRRCGGSRPARSSSCCSATRGWWGRSRERRRCCARGTANH